MKKHISTELMLRSSILIIISVFYGNADAAPSLGNYSLADGVYREALVSGSPGQISNTLQFHDGFLLADPDYYGTEYGTVSRRFYISEPTALIESGDDYDIFKTLLDEGGLFIDGEIWGENENTFYDMIDATAEITTTIFSNGNVTKELLVLGEIDGYSSYTAQFSSTLIETGSEPWLGGTSVVGVIQNASLEIIPEPASLGLLFLASFGIYYTRRFFVV